LTEPDPPSAPRVERPARAEPAAVARSRRRRATLLLVSSVLAVGVIIAARDVLLPFVLALVLAYVLMPLVAWVER
jgi:predicted PurR-regulated permease PerM